LEPASSKRVKPSCYFNTLNATTFFYLKRFGIMMILIAGPYRGGTNDNPMLIKMNLDKLESVALPLFRKGHIPMIGEWVALPLMHLAGSKEVGDSIWDEIQYPVAHRLLEKCDAVLRIEGASKGADEDVRIAKERGLKVYYSLEEIPDLT
jgi:hypothetical protein